MPRSNLLLVLLSFGFLSTVSAPALDCRASFLPVTPGLAILQSVTDATSTVLAVTVRRHEPVRLRLERDGEAPREPDATVLRGLLASPWQVLQATFTGLTPGAEYRLLACDASGTLVDQRVLSTLDVRKPSVRFAVASCMDDSYAREQKGMWDDLVSHRPEALFLIGDNTYADTIRPLFDGNVTPDMLWRRHAETRLLLRLFREPRLVPVFSVWDDHDFGRNDGDSSYRYREESRRIFEAFFPRDLRSSSFQPGPGLASRLSAFGQRFFLLDDRYFRSKETHWGEEQERWLRTSLDGSGEPVWLMNGDQYFGGYHKFESLERNHPAAFARFLSTLRAARPPVVLVSGDRHLVELMEIEPQAVGYRTYELTTSAIHAKTFPDAFVRAKSPRKIEGVAGVLNYAIIDSRATAGGLEATVTAWGPGRKELFRRTLTVRK